MNWQISVAVGVEFAGEKTICAAAGVAASKAATAASRFSKVGFSLGRTVI
jgi:hypothetical protein